MGPRVGLTVGVGSKKQRIKAGHAGGCSDAQKTGSTLELAASVRVRSINQDHNIGEVGVANGLAAGASA